MDSATQQTPDAGFDLARLRRERLAKVQAELDAAGIGAAVLTDPVNIRYCTGIATMSVWSMTNLATYALVPVVGTPHVFAYAPAAQRSQAVPVKMRPGRRWQTRLAGAQAAPQAQIWAGELIAVLRNWGLDDAPLAIDRLDAHGWAALVAADRQLVDADAPLVAARMIKTRDEVELLRAACATAEAALADLEAAVTPGITENELLAVFLRRAVASGGEHCMTRLLTSGQRTNPWFQEASAKPVRCGELVAMDTDLVAAEGYVADVSRTFLCGSQPTAAQRDAYRVAHEFVRATTELLRPGVSYRQLVAAIPALPQAYAAQRYPVVLHGVGVDDEPPWVPFADDPSPPPDGELHADMVCSVECYAGKAGAPDGVKLEDMVLVTADGPEVLSTYPYDDRLLAGRFGRRTRRHGLQEDHHELT